MNERNETIGRPSLDREREYYEDLYSGFAQQHFAKPAVVAFRNHLVKRMIRLTAANRGSRVLSLGSGTGDTELLLAPHTGSIVGIDISPRGVEHATRTAADLGILNASFLLASMDDDLLEKESFDIIIGVFFLHHLPESIDDRLPQRIHQLLKPGGVFYGLDPSSRRLSGMVGKLLIPNLMKKYQTAGEEPLRPSRTWKAFTRAGFEVRKSYYDFASTPLAGLWPSRRGIYLASRLVDDLLVRLPMIRLLSSNFEVLAWKS
jgi:SAM-dependent methyltransferase